MAYIEGADRVYYRLHATNMTTARTPIVDLVQRAAAFRAFFSNFGSAFHDARALSHAARREIAKEALWRAQRAYEKSRLQETPVAQLKQLAHETYPESHMLPEHWGLRWCEFVGPSKAPYLQVFILAAVHRRLRKMLWWRRRRLKGY